MNDAGNKIVTCQACGTRNRITEHPSGTLAKCGKCHAPLRPEQYAADALILRCSQCGGKNRIPMDKLPENPKCGKCHHPIQTDDILIDRPITVTDADFEKWVLNSPLPVYLDCWAAWCSVCRMTMPVVDQLAAQWRGRIRVCRIDVDKNPLVAGRFHIQSTPTGLVFDGGKLRDTMVGAVPKNQLVQRMMRYLG